jgi:hypothetical protein
MKFFTAILLLSLTSNAFAQGSNSVNGFVRRDGTYVAPHQRTNPDSNVYNNWSTKGNVNPYTGQAGRVDPYGTPSRGLYGNSKSNGYLGR